MKNCPICNIKISLNDCIVNTGSPHTFYQIQCSTCGIFSIDSNANLKWKSALRDISDRHKLRTMSNASAWIFRNQKFHIKEENIDLLLNLKTPSFHERADILLKLLEDWTSFAGELVVIPYLNSQLLSMVYCVNIDELNYVINFLAKEERIIINDISREQVRITPKGWAHLEKIKQINIDSKQGFVAMSFDENMRVFYDNGFSLAISDAGYNPCRVDSSEHIDKIDDKIIAGIRSSRFVVADFTHQKGGVYFEAGFALGLGIPVFWTCRKSDMVNLWTAPLRLDRLG